MDHSSGAVSALAFCNYWQPVGFPFTGNSLSFGFLTFISKSHVIGPELLADASTNLKWDSSLRKRKSPCPSLSTPHSDRGHRACPEQAAWGILAEAQTKRTKQWVCSCLYHSTVLGKTCDCICLPALYLCHPQTNRILAGRAVINKAQKEMKALNGAWKRAGK